MSRAPDWTDGEFRLLLSRPNAPASELVELLPRRTEGAIGVVRQGLHEFHQNGETSVLSQTMLRILTDPGIEWDCPICG